MLWLSLSILFLTWHYILMAILVIGYVRRLCGVWVDPAGRRWRHPTWLLVVPVALPLVVVLDLLMLVTSLLPLLRPQERLTQQLSSFLSNYNFTRLFVEFVFESIPQTILQVGGKGPREAGVCMGGAGASHRAGVYMYARAQLDPV
jgi:hypothetical protein